MSDLAAERHVRALQRVRRRMEAEGYRVDLEASDPYIPDFIRDFRPDIIAIRGDERVVVEVKTRPLQSSGKGLRELAESLSQHPGWRLQIVVDDEAEDPPDTLAPEEIASTLSKIPALMTAGQDEAALLLGWASFEAAARRRLRASGGVEPSSTHTLIEQLVHLGLIDDPKAVELQSVLAARNRVAHGFKTDSSPRSIMPRLVELTRQLLRDH